MLSPQALLSPEERMSVSGSDYGGFRSRSNSMNTPTSPPPSSFTSAVSSALPSSSLPKEDQANTDSLWKQVLDPVMEYVQVKLLPLVTPTCTHVLPGICQDLPRPNAPRGPVAHDDPTD